MDKFVGYISFKRKREENPYEAIERLDKKLALVQERIREFITMPTEFGILTTHKFEDNKQLLLKIRAVLLSEINKRHEGLMEITDNFVVG